MIQSTCTVYNPLYESYPIPNVGPKCIMKKGGGWGARCAVPGYSERLGYCNCSCRTFFDMRSLRHGKELELTRGEEDREEEMVRFDVLALFTKNTERTSYITSFSKVSPDMKKNLYAHHLPFNRENKTCLCSLSTPSPPSTQLQRTAIQRYVFDRLFGTLGKAKSINTGISGTRCATYTHSNRISVTSIHSIGAITVVPDCDGGKKKEMRSKSREHHDLAELTDGRQTSSYIP